MSRVPELTQHTILMVLKFSLYIREDLKDQLDRVRHELNLVNGANTRAIHSSKLVNNGHLVYQSSRKPAQLFEISRS